MEPKKFKSLKSWNIAKVCAIAMTVLTLCPCCWADLVTSAFEVDTQLNFAKPDFSDASFTSTLTFNIAPGSTGTKEFDLLFWPNNEGLMFSSTGGVGLNIASAAANTASEALQVTATGAGTFSIRETANHDDDFQSGNPLVVYPSSNTGRAILDFLAPSGGYSTHLDPGINWTTTISMPGDWSQSSAGTIQGTHYLFGYDPAWTLTNDFTFDAATDQTLFKLVNNNYAGANSADDGPYPEFALVGPVVPEPKTQLLLATGLLTLSVAFLRSIHHRK